MKLPKRASELSALPLFKTYKIPSFFLASFPPLPPFFITTTSPYPKTLPTSSPWPLRRCRRRSSATAASSASSAPAPSPACVTPASPPAPYTPLASPSPDLPPFPPPSPPRPMSLCLGGRRRGPPAEGRGFPSGRSWLRPRRCSLYRIRWLMSSSMAICFWRIDLGFVLVLSSVVGRGLVDPIELCTQNSSFLLVDLMKTLQTL